MIKMTENIIIPAQNCNSNCNQYLKIWEFTIMVTLYEYIALIIKAIERLKKNLLEKNYKKKKLQMENYITITAKLIFNLFFKNLE